MNGVGVVEWVSAAWRKNPEIAGLFSGALPAFVVAARPAEPLPGLPVFSYHVVESGGLRADLEFLRRNGYRTVSGRELVPYLQGEAALPERSVLLTFDDGPRNFHDVAYPLLAEYEARALAFVAPGMHADGDDEDSEARPMTWAEIRTIHDSGLVEFQSHTLESRHVPRWPAAASLSGVAERFERARRGEALSFAEDLAASRTALESRLPGAVVDQLAFPQYQGTEGALATAIALGFRACHWGLTPHRPLNAVGDSAFRVSRLSDEFVRRLPGDGRCSLADLVTERLRRGRVARAWRRRYG